MLKPTACHYPKVMNFYVYEIVRKSVFQLNSTQYKPSKKMTFFNYLSGRDSNRTSNVTNLQFST